MRSASITFPSHTTVQSPGLGVAAVLAVTMTPAGMVTICLADSMNLITGFRRRYRVTIRTLTQANGRCWNVLRSCRRSVDRVVELLSIRYLCISLVEWCGQHHNVSHPVDLNSLTATRLRAEVEFARSEMREADAKLRAAREVAEDGAFRNPDGAFGHRSALQRYIAALKAWADHVLDS
jgi:hypothetical protein